MSGFDRTTFDLVVVGAGIVGLGHAYHAVRRGASVCVVERADRVTGASVRNFGHAAISMQGGDALRYATAARKHWIELSEKAGFWLKESGTYLAARTEAELAVLRQFPRCDVLDPDEFAARSGIATGFGGGYSADDVQVDPREAAPAIARYLADQGVEFRWRTTAAGAADGVLHTSRGDLRATWIVYATGHDLERTLPAAAEGAGIRDCALHMLRVEAPVRLSGPLLTGWSLLRYSGLSALPGVEVVRTELADRLPEGAALDLHVMATPQRDGTLLLGDTHLLDDYAGPFQAERGFELLLAEFADLTGVRDIRVRERWQGVYASARGREFWCSEPSPGVFATVVTTGIGMTTALGFTEAFAAEHLSAGLSGL